MMLLERLLIKSSLMCLFISWTILSLMKKVQKLLKHLRKNSVVAAGQLLDNYNIFSPLKQNCEEL